MGFQWDFHVIPIIFHGFPMVFPWFSMVFHGFPWVFHGFSMVFHQPIKGGCWLKPRSSRQRLHGGLADASAADFPAGSLATGADFWDLSAENGHETLGPTVMKPWF